ANRIAKARNIAEEKVLNLIKQNTVAPLFGCLGTEKINVLHLNIELDKLN
ncbi:MAG: potassium-transporting ATPase subunit C, partial [Flavobacterium sp.]|nr:potassium-transporting ATPase subunit C [Flavobacterium sp.]